MDALPPPPPAQTYIPPKKKKKRIKEDNRAFVSQFNTQQRVHGQNQANAHLFRAGGTEWREDGGANNG